MANMQYFIKIECIVLIRVNVGKKREGGK